MEKMTQEEIKKKWGKKGYLNHTSIKEFIAQELPTDNIAGLLFLTVICLASWYFIIKGLIWIVSQLL